ncbi:MAG TPA: response regulator [Candidatus Paceibacterota bacterium]|nr:response regulator [Candidatus Paceibacterota bacterium]
MTKTPKRVKRVLIVEDEPSIMRALATVFVREGFEATTAGDGEEGLAAALRDRPDLIILDIVMPRMDGMEMLTRIRRDGGAWGKSVKAIVYSNLSYNEKHGEAAGVGVKDFLVKADTSLAEVVRIAKETL